MKTSANAKFPWLVVDLYLILRHFDESHRAER